MIRRSLFLAILAAGTACSAQPQRGAAASADATGLYTVTELPRDAPDSGIADVPAKTGRANLDRSAPPFAITPLGQFDEPFAMAFLPDGALLVTEKAGQLKLRLKDGETISVGGVPAVAKVSQGGSLDVAVAPDFATSRMIYLTYAEPRPAGASLALMRVELARNEARCGPPGCPDPGYSLLKGKVIWRAGSDGIGGQFGANVLFAPDGKSLYLSSGERQRFSPAQDSGQRLGKILRLTLDGKAWPGNPDFKAGGVRAETWSSGHRNPYGMVFTPDGRLWEEEMGPRGGDELNLILPGKNYGWPIVSNGDNYSGRPVPDHPSRADLEAPKLWWNPSISPGGMIVCSGAMFPEYRGNLFIAALGGEAMIRVTLAGDRAAAADEWSMGTRIRDVAQGPDGAIWLLEDGERSAGGRLLRLSRK